MGMEILWFRHFSILLGGFRAVFSLLLTVILVGIGAGRSRRGSPAAARGPAGAVVDGRAGRCSSRSRLLGWLSPMRASSSAS